MQEDHGKEWTVIVNPNAGSGRGKKDWKRIAGLLADHHISYSPAFTLSQKHAIALTHDAIKKGYRNFIVVGGDGTMNEVVNGIFTQKHCPSIEITLSQVTVGTGNDWAKMFGIPHEYEKAVGVVSSGKTRLQDVGLAEYINNDLRERRYFLNIAGLGFDALVVRKTNFQKERGRKGRALYFVNLLTSLLQYSNTLTEVDIDGRKVKGKVFTISVGIGRFSGGGMLQTPRAVPDDGLFDITIVKNIGKGDIILSLKKLYDGTILEHPKIEGFTGKDIAIDSKPPIHLETDGETLGHSPVRFRILPRSIQVVTNN